ncbi:alpha/beta hydrolase family protein [Nannocystaceae bacterium ST9]
MHRAFGGSILISVTIVAGVSFGCDRGRRSASEVPGEAADPEPERSFLARRAQAKTELDEHGPSPGKWAPLQPPPGVMAIEYPSGELNLAAWVAWPLGASEYNRAPALVYFHGDFAFGADDFEVVRGWLDAGFMVMTPMLRGENGNPGEFELLWGEVDDARAAVDWIAQQPAVDRSRIYAFGHSIGGGISAMLSLYPELPLRRTGSCGGIYVPETFARWAKSETNDDLIRFDPSDPDEIQLRVLGPNVAWMFHQHVAYVGAQDPWFADNAQLVLERAWAKGKPFEVIEVEGDHMNSLPPALAAFLELARRDLPR